MTADISDITSYDWIVSTTRNLSNGNVFFFQVRNASNLSDQDEIFASHYFNITENLSATTASSSASSSKGATLEGTAGTSVSSPTATKAHPILSTRTASTETGSSSKYGGLSLGAKIGLGAGAETVFTLIQYWLEGYICVFERGRWDRTQPTIRGCRTMAVKPRQVCALLETLRHLFMANLIGTTR